MNKILQCVLLSISITLRAQYVSTLAGSVSTGSNNGPGPIASFYYPCGVCSDASGNIYVADQYNHLIRMISTTGSVSVLAGSGTAGYIDATGASASFNHPYSICMGINGNIYVGELSNRIRMITPGGVVTTIAGSGLTGSVNATGTAASFNHPNAICMDNSGNIFVADFFNNKIRQITSLGVVTTFAGSGGAGAVDATGTAATFNGPTGICIDATGNLYVSEYYNNKVRKITTSGVVTTFAGSGTVGATDATGILASFNGPSGIGIDASGNILVSDTYNNKIRMISPSNVVTTLAGTGIAGATDATVTLATFDTPIGICTNSTGDIYIADSYSQKIRRIGVCITPALPYNITATTSAIVCSGNSTTLTALSYGTVNWFSSASGSIAIATGSSYVTSNTLAPGNYSLYAEGSTCTLSAGRSVIPFTVNVSPIITINSGAICLGETFTINPSGANTYTIQGGSNTVSPISNTSYTATGTSIDGCLSQNTVTSNVIVNAHPTINVNSGTICAGGIFTISPSGANTYTIQGGSNMVSPSATTSYSIVGTDMNGCVSPVAVVSSVMVNPNPIITAASNRSLMCAGESATITASGALTYTWSSSANTTTIAVSPTSNTTFSVLGSNSNGCLGSAVFTQNVDACNAITKNEILSEIILSVYPNPNSGEFIVKLAEKKKIIVYNLFGILVYESEVEDSTHHISLFDMPNGLYFVHLRGKNSSTPIKIIKN